MKSKKAALLLVCRLVPSLVALIPLNSQARLLINTIETMSQSAADHSHDIQKGSTDGYFHSHGAVKLNKSASEGAAAIPGEAKLCSI
jgi:hypothetical protein